MQVCIAIGSSVVVRGQFSSQLSPVPSWNGVELRSLSLLTVPVAAEPPHQTCFYFVYYHGVWMCVHNVCV